MTNEARVNGNNGWSERYVPLWSLVLAVVGTIGGAALTVVIATQGYEQRTAKDEQRISVLEYRMDQSERTSREQAERIDTNYKEMRVYLDSISSDIQTVIVQLAVHEGRAPTLPQKPKVNNGTARYPK